LKQTHFSPKEFVINQISVVMGENQILALEEKIPRFFMADDKFS
jgi:hypothetical protein